MIRGFGKLSVLAFIFFSGTHLFAAFDVAVINGRWLDKSAYDYMAKNQWSGPGNAHVIGEDSIFIEWDISRRNGSISFGPEKHNIADISQEPSNNVRISYGWENSLEFVVKIISHDILEVIAHPYDGIYTFLYRISDPAKQALASCVIKNDGVRFRMKPLLSSGIFWLLDREKRVAIIGRGKQKERIGAVEEYWYEVRHILYETGPYYVDGWVFGAYLNIKDRAKLEAYFNNKNNWGF